MNLGWSAGRTLQSTHSLQGPRSSPDPGLDLLSWEIVIIIKQHLELSYTHVQNIAETQTAECDVWGEWAIMLSDRRWSPPLSQYSPLDNAKCSQSGNLFWGFSYIIDWPLWALWEGVLLSITTFLLLFKAPLYKASSSLMWWLHPTNQNQRHYFSWACHS